MDKDKSVFKPLRKMSSAESLAKRFGLKYEQLSKLIYPTTDHSYISFTITKKSGGERSIDAPKAKLKRIQSQLARWLLTHHNPKHSAHGFIAGRSIKTNALRHVNKRYVFNVDLKDFRCFSR